MSIWSSGVSSFCPSVIDGSDFTSSLRSLNIVM